MECSLKRVALGAVLLLNTCVLVKLLSESTALQHKYNMYARPCNCVSMVSAHRGDIANANSTHHQHMLTNVSTLSISSMVTLTIFTPLC